MFQSVFRSSVSCLRSVPLCSFGAARQISFNVKSVPPLIKSYVNGQYIDSVSNETLDVIDPTNGQIMTTMQIAGQTEVDYAVKCAKEAQVEWGALSGLERSRILRKAADRLTEMNDELAAVEALDTGRPIAETLIADIVSVRDAVEYMSNCASTHFGQHITQPDGSFAYTRREPLGVTAGIGAWNYPMQSAGWKAAPSLAAGNAMVFKPSEETPLTALLLAEVFVESGLPAGLFNVVLGKGPTGNLLSSHKGISKISFTGSAQTGKKVYEAGAANIKKVTLELGGKSPLIIFEDADIDNAVSATMMANFFSNGQVCSNGTRVFVHKSIKDKFLKALVDRTTQMKLGHPLDESTDIGPMVSKSHYEKVMRYIEIGKKEGAKLVCGGTPVDGEGYYLTPAIFDDCTDDMTIVKEEIFGMVCSILPFETDDEVIVRANDTELGLSAGLFTKDLKRAHTVVAQLQAGTTWINNYNLAPVELPWGGMKESGLGRENGSECLKEWSQVKSVYVEMNDVWTPYK